MHNMHAYAILIANNVGTHALYQHCIAQHREHSVVITYRIALYFRGAKISRLARIKFFVE
jgi:hypothetical protein